ncbi:TPA: phage filamentation protein Fil family protein [Escherichia coli]
MVKNTFDPHVRHPGDIPSFASLLRSGCQVTHCKSTRGWLETPDGRYFKPEPSRVQFIKGRNKPFVYTQKINRGVISALIKLIKRYF